MSSLRALARRYGLAVDDGLLGEIAARGGDVALACGVAYERRLAADRERRRAGGAYYTPAHLVDFVVEQTVGAALRGRSAAEALGLRVVDPACGGGAFLVAALRRIERHVVAAGEPCGDGALSAAPVSGPALRRRIAERCLVGLDIDPGAAAVCRLALLCAIGGDGDEGGLAALDGVRVADGLRGDDAGWADAVVGNPPWGQKGFRFPPAEAAYLRRRYRTATGVLDPFKLFVERAVELSRPGGRVGLVLPDIVLLKNHQPLRELLLAETAVEWICDAGRAFEGVNLDAVVIVARKAPPPAAHRVRVWHRLDADWRARPPVERSVRQQVFGELPGRRFNIHITDEALARLRRLATLPRLGDLFEIHEGVHSGNLRAELFLAERPPGEAAPLVVGRGEIARYVLRWGGAWLNLAPGLIDRAAGRYANLGRREWHERDKLVVRRTGDRVVAAQDRRGLWVSNNAFVVIPRRPMSSDELCAFVALLNSGPMTWYFRTVQPRVGRLFAELKIEHLRDFPIPAPAAWRAALSPLAAAARRLEHAPDDPAALAAVERHVAEALAGGATGARRRPGRTSPRAGTL